MRGNHDHTTRDAVLAFIREDSLPCAIGAIVAHMRRKHHADAGAVRECVRRLLKEGKITHPAWGMYQRLDQG